MSGDKAFFDTNLLIYAFAEDDPCAEIAETLAAGGVVGVRNLNEFVAVEAATRHDLEGDSGSSDLSAIRVLCSTPVLVTVETHDAALRIARKHGHHIDDSLVVAAAIQASCGTL